ncbi:CoA pyrophosphatase [Salinicola avicenniae]|uniref:CoA pyrophosphatase n=1 Tax=Salinicola avicenniae TaxID=2916836 RepID=UPI002073FA7D|nr:MULTISPECIES: CoA pyrophosphatase [unclassified Salinicola]
MLEKLRQRLQAHRPMPLDASLPQAAVLLPVVTHAEPTLLLTQRTRHLKQHAGQVAFPGGKREPADADLLATALRESREEIALPPSEVEVIGQLSDVLSLHGLRVTPYVGLVPPDLPLLAEPGEIETIFEVPLRYLLGDPRTHTDVIEIDEVAHYIPSYRVDGRVIWGLSAMMLVELLVVGFTQPLSLIQPPPTGELRYHPRRSRTAAAGHPLRDRETPP